MRTRSTLHTSSARPSPTLRRGGRNLLTLGLVGGLMSGLLLSATGCEDTAARQRVEAQQTIEAATADFRKARVGNVTPEDDQFEAVQSQLNGVVTRLASLNEGEAGQLAAGALLASDALRELAAMNVLESQAIERRLQSERSVISDQVKDARRLGGVISGMASISADAQRVKIQQRRQAAQEQINTLAQHIEQLNGPISERTRLNTEDAERVQNLRREANELLRQAIELGHSSGFDSYQQALRQRREADQIEYRMAHRDLDLNLELLPAQHLSESRIEGLRDMVESIRTALRDLDAYEQFFAGEVARLRQNVADLRSEIMEGITTISQTMNGQLAASYDQAVEQLGRAATQARQAAGRLRGTDANAARMVEARSLESHGTLLWSRAMGISHQISLLDAVIEAQDALGDVAEARRQREALVTTRSDLISQAQAQLTAANTILAQLSGRGLESLDELRTNLQRMIDSLSGAEVDVSSAAGSPRSAVVSRPTGMDMNGGPTDLLAILDQLQGMTAEDFRQFSAMLPRGMQELNDAQREAALQSMRHAAITLRPRVESGEIANLEALMQALAEHLGAGGMM